jgi:hypothetical protein
METKIADLLSMEKATRGRALRGVAIGRGTGLSTLLKGLKRFARTPAEVNVKDLIANLEVPSNSFASGFCEKFPANPMTPLDPRGKGIDKISTVSDPRSTAESMKRKIINE